ncbi:AbaSI family restriction endonuclease, partial [uncultured Helcococcus sp.]|uniref:AbaSI family restriction endonuclease n=1 Tax=uncultured Helcococcus sp. TaxID=1072508 RepID=UPI00288C14EF
MNKLNYIVRTLARTKRKDFENYVINRIYNELDDLEIKPNSQQYVKRSENKYALIDLYFPQLNIGIECDEYQHEEQKNLDELRYFDILNAIKSKDEYEEIRIKVYDRNNEDNLRDIEDVNKDINNAVKRIKEKKKNTKDFIPWDMTPDKEKAIKKGSVVTCTPKSGIRMEGFSHAK